MKRETVATTDVPRVLRRPKGQTREWVRPARGGGPVVIRLMKARRIE